MILVIDNYDSFTYNLYQYIGELYDDIKVVRNDEIGLDEIEGMYVEGIVLSPGPGRPENAGICMDVIKRYGSSIPILGICLGHQTIGAVFGGNVIGAGEIKHGKTSFINHDESLMFKGIKNPLRVMRYHSLIVERNLPEELVVTAESEDGEIMGIRHKCYPVFGLQFHPESILTEQGKEIIKNFLEVTSCFRKQ